MLPEPASTAVQRVALVASSGRELADLAGPLVARLASLRHKPICLAADLDATCREALRHLGAEAGPLVLPAGGLNPFAEFRARRQAVAALNAIRPHAILAIDLAAASAMAGLARRAGCRRLVVAPASIEAHETDRGIDMPADVERQLRLIMPAATGFAVTSATEARILRSLEFYADAPVEIAPQRGIELGGVPHRPLPQAAGGVLFTAAARDLTSDDIATLTAAMARVAKQAPTARLTIAGALASDIDRARVADLGGKLAAVAFDDRDEALGEAIAASHVYVHARARPGVTSALLEALAVGRPIVATDVGGAREAVDEVVNGILAAPGDPAALGDAMTGAVRRQDLLAVMGEASRRKAERRFDAADVNAVLLGALGIPFALGSVA